MPLPPPVIKIVLLVSFMIKPLCPWLTSAIFRSCFREVSPANRRHRCSWAPSLSGASLPLIRGREDIPDKVFKRSRCGVLRRTRLLLNEDSCVDGFVHLDVHRGSLRRNPLLRQH